MAREACAKIALKILVFDLISDKWDNAFGRIPPVPFHFTTMSNQRQTSALFPFTR
jgi:hypothetical protein